MRIAIDLRPLQIGHEHRGIGIYLINILSRMPRSANSHFIFYQYDTSDPLDDHQIERPDSCETIKIPKPVWRRSAIDLIKYVKAGLYPRFPKLSASHPDIFFQADFQLGLPKIRGCRNYVVMYDLIPLILSDIYMPSWREPLSDKGLRWYSRLIVASKKWYHQKRYYKNLARIKRAYRILSISKSTTHDLQRCLGIEKSRVKTILLAPSFRNNGNQKDVRSKIKKQISELKSHYITFIGGTDARRKIEELVYAFNIINSRGIDTDMVLAGNEFRKLELIPNVAGRNAIIASPYKNRIHLLGYLSEAEKEYVLKNAAAFVYPTLYEGFGLPILEAMQVGCPVVTFRNSSIPEISNNTVSYAPRPDIQGIVSAVSNVLTNPKQAKSMAAKGKSRAKKFNWDTTAKKTWQTILNP